MLPAVSRRRGGGNTVPVRIADLAYVMEAARIQLGIEQDMAIDGEPLYLNKFRRLEHCLRRLEKALERKEV